MMRNWTFELFSQLIPQTLERNSYRLQTPIYGYNIHKNGKDDKWELSCLLEQSEEISHSQYYASSCAHEMAHVIAKNTTQQEQQSK